MVIGEEKDTRGKPLKKWKDSVKELYRKKLEWTGSRHKIVGRKYFWWSRV